MSSINLFVKEAVTLTLGLSVKDTHERLWILMLKKIVNFYLFRACELIGGEDEGPYH
jgi:hypothetical protein